MNIKDFDLSSIQRIGLDKIQLSGFAIESIDYQILLNKDKTVDNAQKCNLVNMTHAEYTEYIYSVLAYVEHRYGIVLLTGYMKLDYVEVNANIVLKQEFSKYTRTLRLLMSLFDNHLGKLRTYSNLKDKDKKGLQDESYVRGNKSKDIVFYDKTQELNDTDTPIEDDVPATSITNWLTI